MAWRGGDEEERNQERNKRSVQIWISYNRSGALKVYNICIALLWLYGAFTRYARSNSNAGGDPSATVGNDRRGAIRSNDKEKRGKSQQKRLGDTKPKRTSTLSPSIHPFSLIIPPSSQPPSSHPSTNHLTTPQQPSPHPPSPPSPSQQ